MLTETLTWYTPSERLPDCDTTVLIEVEDAEGDPVWPGYLDSEEWRLADGMPVAKVLRWCEMPKGGAT
jgi:hypothetical protein